MAGGGPWAARARTALVASAPLLLGVVLAALVCYPFADGRLLLLDFVSGPHQPLLPAKAFGLDGGLTGGVPLAIGFRLLDRLLGQAGSVVPAAIFFPLATTGAARLLRTAVLPARLGAGLFYAVNPFVFDRLYAGQLGVLLGYALLPFAVAALLDAAQEPHRVGRAACWAGATVMMSEHFAWILVPVTAAIVLTRPHRVRASLRLGAAALGAAAISSYLLVAPVLAGTSPAGPLTQLAAYRTRGDPRVGLLVNVAGLYGFFRPGPTEPKNLFSGWPAVLAALLLIVAVGYVAVLRDAAHRRNGLAILAAGVAGYFLALGDQGPTGGLFRLAYEHVPGFVMMREPDKFAVLVALAYAYGFGWGIALAHDPEPPEGRPDRGHRTGDCLASCLHAEPARWPRRPGQGQRTPVLVVHRLASCRAGHGAVPALARVLPDPVHRPADDRQPGGPLLRRNRPHQPESRPLVTASPPRTPSTSSSTRCSARQLTCNGRSVALAGLGVRFVALAKVADWRDFARVGDVPGIRLVYSSPSLDLFSVTADRPGDTRRPPGPFP